MWWPIMDWYSRGRCTIHGATSKYGVEAELHAVGCSSKPTALEQGQVQVMAHSTLTSWTAQIHQGERRDHQDSSEQHGVRAQHGDGITRSARYTDSSIASDPGCWRSLGNPVRGAPCT